MKSMMIVLAIVLMIVIVTVILIGCGRYIGTDGGKTKYQEAATEVTELTISHYSDTPAVTYVFSRNEEGSFFKVDEYKENNELSKISEDTYNRINEWVDTYNIRSWDGFDKSRKDVLDGGGFRIEITLATGETITAHGNNAYPNGYGDANRALNDIIEEAKDSIDN